MIHDAASLTVPLTVVADLCVVGSGAGGAAAAMVAAEAGLRVVVLEAGPFLAPDHMTQREDRMLPQLYWDAAARTTADRGIRIHQGRGVGGSTLHNLNLCKRIPTPILSQWQRDRGLTHLPVARWQALYDEVETLLSVSEVPADKRNRHNQILADGATKLGWRHGGMKHNRSGCTESGFCEIGCAFDAKNNAAKVLLPRAIRAGATVLAHCQAVRVEHSRDRVQAVSAVARTVDGDVRGQVRIVAPRVCLSASATGTAAILLRSETPAPAGSVGDGLRIHPAVVAAGEFADPVQAWKGIPQSVECTQLLDFDSAHPASGKPAVGAVDRVWIVPAFGHPLGTATMLPGYGPAHNEIMARYNHLAPLAAMLHDLTRGTVRPDGDLGLTIQWWPDAEDRRQLTAGLRACAELLLAAGASRVLVPTHQLMVIDERAGLSAIDRMEWAPGTIDISAVHPMATVPMGDDPSAAAVDSNGRHHRVAGLWVADGSLFPTSIGVPPQLSIYALGLHVGRALVAAG